MRGNLSAVSSASRRDSTSLHIASRRYGGFGDGLAGLEPDLQNRLVHLADGIEDAHRADALVALAGGVAELTLEL